MYLSDVKTGIDFERYVQDVLRHSGMVVRDTKKSNDFGADIIANYMGVTYAIQCKFSKNLVGVKAVQEVVAAKVMYQAQVGVVVTNSEFTINAKKLAMANDIILFDGPSSEPYVSDDSEMGLDYYLLQKLFREVSF